METEFIFWRHDTSAGIRVEEISGGEDKSASLWKTMALQVFGENGGDRFREIVHRQDGAPLLEDLPHRISVSHTSHFMVIAMLPRTPEADLENFSVRTAMGIDCEPALRRQVLKVAGRVMMPEEIQLTEEYAATLTLPEDSGLEISDSVEDRRVIACMLSWTVKEALYKAALTEGLDFRTQLRIESLPELCGYPMDPNPRYGKARIILSDKEIEMELFSYLSEGHIVTLAYSPKCAKFKRS